MVNFTLSRCIVGKIFSMLSKLNPHPKSELEYTSPYTFLVAVVLSARTTDISVNKVTKKLFAIADSPEKMLLLREEILQQYMKGIGLYNRKVKNIMALSGILVDRYQSCVPNNLEDLMSLPGVGKKSANVVLNCVFLQPTIAVDTHVFRVSNRLGLCETKNPEQTEQVLLKVIPKKWHMHASNWLILHGRYICKAKKPLCSDCCIKKFCWFNTNK
ncbi:Endonuclease III [Alphaproteobacteria bacterium]